MDDKVFEDIEIAPPSVVKQAARNFAAVLAETPQFKAFEQAADLFQHDQVAQETRSTAGIPGKTDFLACSIDAQRAQP